MSALLREEVEAALDEVDTDARLVITPLLDRERQLGPGTVDLRLGSEFLEISRRERKYVDPFDGLESRKGADQKSYVPLGGEFILHPGQFVLGSTLEFIRLPAYMTGQVLSRSSWGRIGLLVATAVAVQPGYTGILTLELVNMGSVPVVLRPGLRIAQLQLWKSEFATQHPYGQGAKYRTPLGPESSRLTNEFVERERLEYVAGRMQGDSTL